MPVSRTMRTWGIKYFFRKNRWELSLAYFQNADFSGTGGDTDCPLAVMPMTSLDVIRRCIRAMSGWYIISETCEDSNSEVRYWWVGYIIWTHGRRGSVPISPYTTSSTINGGTLKYTSCFWTVSACTMILAC